jgi:hypothetical protein
VVQALLDEQTNNAVGVEDEVGAVCVLVADDAAERRSMSVDVQSKWSSQKILLATYVRREINWGVCGRMCTLA